MNQGLFGFPVKNLASNFLGFPKKQVVKESGFGFPYNYPAYIFQCTPIVDNYAFSLVIAGEVGNNIIIDWGDNSTTTVNLLSTDQTITHTYQFRLSYSINFIGNTSAVTKIVITNKRLTGKLPLNFASIFSNIKHFDINTNRIEGTVPDISSLRSLEYLNISSNAFIGDAPPIDTFENLINYWVTSNSFSGSLPNPGNCTLLVNYMAYGNKFTGAIPSFANCPLLQNIQVHDNANLAGPLPDFANCPLLIAFKVSGNLAGPLPSFNHCLDLINFQAASCNFNGELPSFANCPLRYFVIYSNQFSGILPSFNLKNGLQYFQVNNNNFSGEIPSFSNQTNLATFHLYSNNFSSLVSVPNTKMSACNLSVNALNTASVDLVLSQLNAIFTASAPTGNLSLTLNGGTNSPPTNGTSNTDLLNLVAIFGAAGRLFTYTFNN